MFLSNIFKYKKKTKNQESLEKEYLKIKPKDNIYGFQKKFYMQSNRLLKIFGNARNSLPNKISLIIITDTHNTLDENLLIETISEHPNYDLCLLLGDHSDNDIEKVLKHITKDKIYALLGNHDINYVDSYGFNNLNGNIITIHGVKILGIQGSFKYKPSDFPLSHKKKVLNF